VRSRAAVIKPLRQDEQFVVAAIADHFRAAWKAGENPPDARLQLSGNDIALEVTTLEQFVIDEKRGGHKPRRSKDTTAAILAKELDRNLRATIPNGMAVILTLNSPISKARKTKSLLARLITRYVKDFADTIHVEIVIEGNEIGIRIKAYNDTDDSQKVFFVGRNLKSDPNILKNAWCILEERIRTKTEKCRGIRSEIWLGLLNNYWLAESETYRRALGLFSVAHPFSKILLVSADGTVETLYTRGPMVDSVAGGMVDRNAPTWTRR